MNTVDFNKIKLHPDDKVLDIGCGSGRHTCSAAMLENVFSVGADLSPEDVAMADERLRENEPYIKGRYGTLSADITNLPFADGAFDLVICSEVLEHIPEHHSALTELVRVLKPGGNLVVSVPSWLPERICWALSKNYHQCAGGHVRIYEKRQLEKMLAWAGVRKWADSRAHSLHAPYWWLKCIVGPDNEGSSLVKLYHRFLVWDMMKKPRLTRFMDKALNPVIGKSTVIYTVKDQ